MWILIHSTFYFILFISTEIVTEIVKSECYAYNLVTCTRCITVTYEACLRNADILNIFSRPY